MIYQFTFEQLAAFLSEYCGCSVDDATGAECLMALLQELARQKKLVLLEEVLP
jgi:hypothetical protein